MQALVQAKQCRERLPAVKVTLLPFYLHNLLKFSTQLPEAGPYFHAVLESKNFGMCTPDHSEVH